VQSLSASLHRHGKCNKRKKC